MALLKDGERSVMAAEVKRLKGQALANIVALANIKQALLDNKAVVTANASGYYDANDIADIQSVIDEIVASIAGL